MLSGSVEVVYILYALFESTRFDDGLNKSSSEENANRFYLMDSRL
jgi:hypothetical protein